MIILIALAASVHAARPTMPLAIRGTWDLPNHCQRPADDSVSRVIVRETNVVFWEAMFSPERIIVAAPANWTATGKFSEEEETSNARLNLRLSTDGSTLAYTNSDKHVVRLVRCKSN
jgi:hypothetical protein